MCAAFFLWIALSALSPASAAVPGARAEEPLPPAPEVPAPPDPYTPEVAPSFGSDVAVGYAVGALLGSWPEPGPWGSVLARYEAFLVPASASGPRLGLSLWGSATAWPMQRFSEEEGARAGSFRATAYGAMTVVRGDPALRVGPAAGLGFGRIDLSDYYEGPLAIPVLNFEGGARIRVRDPVFFDVLARAHWGTTRSPTADSLHEWWAVQLLLTPGLHLR